MQQKDHRGPFAVDYNFCHVYGLSVADAVDTSSMMLCFMSSWDR